MSRRFRLKQAGSYLFILPYAASFACFIVLPFIVALVLSFLQFDLTSQESVQFVGLRNFADALQDAYFWKAVKATFTFVILMVPLMLIGSMLLALLPTSQQAPTLPVRSKYGFFSKPRFRGSVGRA